ncbi:F-box/FBD/LRR-repeat protein At1g13570-like [Mercurialis annua]|uniref:F-box/FBD/LRR-repeat protein At1g13570-like n=1 Tax=Mercurialis annua TaxID=3986 RepID=UPI00215F1A54|nr:F-box/FBD/LRR-repeat protein At1g13570-like [Mercurialis annua]XP_050224294.1 F-box/FBD/LRR-repeat protein At1g13570-like [Mercurialis annua]XP_050224295.1 F-box/FBD/LRR-repeat protein At1g13570-like [Mercurialis annua]XP_050224296.1 F-box/FBD/LRR-repeat protein At1g13570-like [Mercurialis annua]XP_055961306.1 F-box/FBD/LRR-repeat protein At1g13570-like [Mercurialis annua]
METTDNHLTKKIKRCSSADRISNLPSDIIDNILTCLPIKEAVKTSVLSKKWRFKWRYLSKLVFDNTFYQIPGHLFPEKRSKPFFDMYKVLLLHRGPIFHFSLWIHKLEIYPEINQLMLYLSEKDVREIMLRGYYFDIVPSFLFSCVTLRSLTLHSCKFKVPPAFQGFVKLVSLSFERVDFKTDLFETFISKCPLLKRLSLVGCTKTGQPYEPTKLLESAPMIEHLHLGSGYVDFLQYGTLWRKLSLGSLKVLELPRVYIVCTDHVSSVLNLIVSSPNLEKLDIGFVTIMDGIQALASELLKVQDLLDNALKKLRMVKLELSDTKEVKPDLEFIKFILAESVVLEKMYIEPAHGTVAEDGLQILKEIVRLQRSSKKAEILYLD